MYATAVIEFGSESRIIESKNFITKLSKLGQSGPCRFLLALNAYSFTTPFSAKAFIDTDQKTTKMDKDSP